MYTMEIIYEDNNLIVAYKEAGVLAQSDRSFAPDMVSMLKTYLSQKGEKPYVAVINRLDRPVSGIMLFAKNEKMAAALSRELTAQGIGKHYMAVVCGKPEKESGMLEDYLVKDSRNNVSGIAGPGDKDAKKAQLEYKVIASKVIEDREYTLLDIRLITGRHHQIRVQMSGHRMPLLGDTKYGSASTLSGIHNISLCSYRLSFMGREFKITPHGEGFEYFKEELATLA